MAYFSYRLEISADDKRYASIVAVADGTGPDCTGQHTGKEVAFATAINTEDPAIFFQVPLSLSAVEKVVATIKEHVDGNNK